jgi:hypothetical protein
MAPAIFKNMVFAKAGPLDGQMTDENIALWAAQRRGRFSKEWNDEVTHLLCTVKQLEQRGRVGRFHSYLKAGHMERKLTWNISQGCSKVEAGENSGSRLV